jgi:hypothetical protein
MLIQKFKANLETRFERERVNAMVTMFEDAARLERMPVEDFVNNFVTGEASE